MFYLRCRKCFSSMSIKLDQKELFCLKCQHKYSVQFGIVDFFTSNPDTDDNLAQMLSAHFLTDSHTDLLEKYFAWVKNNRLYHRSIEHFRQYKLSQLERGRRFVEMFLDYSRRYFRLPSQQQALDIGCGTGTGLLDLSKRFSYVVGIDPNLSNLLLARKLLDEHNVTNVLLIRAIAQEIPCQSGCFDFVMAQNVLEHVLDVKPAICEIARVLRPNGVFAGDSRNRFDLFFPEPHTGIRWLGFLPRHWAKKYVQWRLGQDYNHTLLLSYFDLQRLFKNIFGGKQYKILFPNVEAYGYSNKVEPLLNYLNNKSFLLPKVILVVFPSQLVIAQKNY